MAPSGGKVPTRLQRVGSKSGLARPGSKTGLVVSGLGFGSSSSGGLSSRASTLPTAYVPPGAYGAGGGGRGGGGGRYSPGRFMQGAPSRWGLGSFCPTGTMRMLVPVLLASLLSSLVTYYIILTHPMYGTGGVGDGLPLLTTSRTLNGDRIDLRMGIQLQKEHPIDSAAAAVAFTKIPHGDVARQQAAAAGQRPAGGGAARPQQQTAVQQAAKQQQQQPQQQQPQPQPQPTGSQLAAAAAAKKPAAASVAPKPSGQTVNALRAEQERIAHIINQQHLFGVEGDRKPVGPPHFGKGGPGTLRMAVVNHAPYHLEIVAGMLHIFRDYNCQLKYYQAGQSAPDKYSAQALIDAAGFGELLGGLPPGLLHSTDEKPEPADFAIFISPEYFVPETKAFLDQLAPQSALMLVHNGNNPQVQALTKLHPKLHFAALAPHVAQHSREHLHVHTHWLLAVHPFKASNPCILSANSPLCLHGFSIQGNFEPQRRNYTRMWKMLEDHKKTGKLANVGVGKPMHLHLLGRGRTEWLHMPPDVADMTTVHAHLKFPDYYEQIHHTHGLVLMLGSPVYLQYKMSSTLVSSLATGVPIIADDPTMKAYTYLHPDHVFTMGKGEDEVDVMLRVLAMPPEEVQAKRRAVVALAQHLNLRTLLLIKTFMPPHKS